MNQNYLWVRRLGPNFSYFINFLNHLLFKKKEKHQEKLRKSKVILSKKRRTNKLSINKVGKSCGINNKRFFEIFSVFS